MGGQCSSSCSQKTYEKNQEDLEDPWPQWLATCWQLAVGNIDSKNNDNNNHNKKHNDNNNSTSNNSKIIIKLITLIIIERTIIRMIIL